MRIQHNIMAMNSYRNYTANNSALSKNLEKLSSGYKINRAGDDAAGLAISEKMRAQITGLETAQSNAQSGINLVQTAEGALTEVHDMLNRMVELADQSANGTYDDSTDRTNLQKEFTALSSEIDRIADASNFNGIKLLNGKLGGYNGSLLNADSIMADNGVVVSGGALAANDTVTLVTATDGKLSVGGTTVNGVTFVLADGVSTSTAAAAESGKTYTFTAKVDPATASAAAAAKYEGLTISATVGTAATSKNAVFTVQPDGEGNIGGGLTLQIGDTANDYNQIKVSIADMHTSGIGIADLSIENQESAATAVDKIRGAIDKVSATRGDLGATQNRLEHTINNLSVMTENIQDAEANIRDVDVAKEMMEYTKNNILVQSAQAMLAQANQVPQGVLQLLQ